MQVRSSPSHNLPTSTTTFIGRERELAALTLQLDMARLLTLTGPGGCGKTRLALQIASQLLPGFTNGACWCDLAAVTDPSYMPQSVARALHLSEAPHRPVLDSLVEALRPQHKLLILDNCEHLLVACAELVHALLSGCADVKILATSLQPLNLPQEKVFAVPPLALPEAGPGQNEQRLSQSDAVRLFVERAREAFPSFALDSATAAALVGLCRRLDGLPLAIELAAARVKMLSVPQIAERLDDAFQLLTRGPADALPRHQTLRTTMEWTHQFLTEAEQALLRRLSVFAGSFTLDAVEAVCVEEQVGPGLLDFLSDLAEKSFVFLLPREGEEAARYRLLETIRQYAREKLEGSGETAVTRTRLLEWCQAFAERAEPKLAGPEAGAWMMRLQAELDNVRAALQWVRTSRAVESGLRLASALWLFWLNRGYLTEGQSWLEELLALEASLTQTPVTPSIRAKALYATAVLAFRRGDLARATTLAEASLSLAREALDQPRLGTVLNLLAILATEQGDYTRAASMHEEALALNRRLGDTNRVSVALVNLGVIARRRSEYSRAVALYEEALAIKRQLGDKATVALILSNLAEIAIWQSHYAHATALLDESLSLFREQDNHIGVALALNNLGVIARYRGEAYRARALFEESLDLMRTAGEKTRLSTLMLNLGDLARDDGDWAHAQTIYSDCLVQFKEAGDKSSWALALHSLGLVASGQHDEAQALALHRPSLELYRSMAYPLGMVEALEALASALAALPGEASRSAQWLAVAETQREAMGVPVPAPDHKRYDHTVQILRATLGESAYAAIQAEARRWPLEQVVGQALGAAETPSASGITTPPHPALSIFALGPVRVSVGHHTLTSADWTYTKSKEMLFYLLEHPQTDKAHIGLDLWPDASPAQLRNIFHRALHQLRRALSEPDWITFADGRYAFNRARPFDYDVLTFETHLRQARAEMKSGPTGRTRAIEHLEAALPLWRGDFLADMETGEWAIFRREALRQTLVDALLQLGGLHFAEAHYAAATEVYLRVLAYDDYLEVAHRELLRCYARQGEASRAVRHYHDLRERLHTELHSEPSPETTLLYERLRRGDDI